MKKLLTYVLFAAMLVATTSCGPTTDDAIKYNDKIINEQVKIITKINELYKAFDDYTNFAKIDKCYADAQAQLQTGTDAVTQLDKFDGNADFRDGALKLFGLYKSILQNELKQMIAINRLPNDQFTPEIKDKMQKLGEQSMKKMDDGLAELQQTQSAFAKKYKFEIKKSD